MSSLYGCLTSFKFLFNISFNFSLLKPLLTFQKLKFQICWSAKLILFKICCCSFSGIFSLEAINFLSSISYIRWKFSEILKTALWFSEDFQRIIIEFLKYFWSPNFSSNVPKIWFHPNKIHSSSLLDLKF